MRSRYAILTVLVTLFAFFGTVMAADTEQEILEKFLKKSETKRVQRLGWASATYSYNRINRHNDYNSFTNYVNGQLSGGRLDWLNAASSVGLEFGAMVKKNVAWSVGGEYGLKFGQTVKGTVTYTPAGGTPTTLTNPSSEMKTIGFYTTISYYFLNPPQAGKQLNGFSLYGGGMAGYYQLNWDVFPQYQNLNLSTAAPDGANTTFKGSAPAFGLQAGAEYPVGFGGLTLSAEASYLVLNFKNVSWYNTLDQEVVATYGGTSATRVNVSLSGVRGKVLLKKFFNF